MQARIKTEKEKEDLQVQFTQIEQDKQKADDLTAQLKKELDELKHNLIEERKAVQKLQKELAASVKKGFILKRTI